MGYGGYWKYNLGPCDIYKYIKSPVASSLWEPCSGGGEAIGPTLRAN